MLKNTFLAGVLIVTLFSLALVSSPVSADTKFSDKAIAVIQSCSDNSKIYGFATLKERASKEGVKLTDVYMQVLGLDPGRHGVHIHETASCIPCGSAGGHFDPGPNSNTNPDGNHPFHSGDLINIESDYNLLGLLTTQTTRVTLSKGPLSVFDNDGSAFIVHINPDTYCPDGGDNDPGCAGGGRAACGIITKPSTIDNLELKASRKENRENPVELADAELDGKAYIFLSPEFPRDSISQVTYFLNGKRFKIEYRAPYDFAGTKPKGEAAEFDTKENLKDGTHSIAAIIALKSGQSSFVSSTFTVDNTKQTFGNGQDYAMLRATAE